ncbi:putative gamma interferon inducible lysosomal thiol reductase GILT [Rosa chinensis]|uniref:Putative gamma interferon inducible lysosomal thiol reductase GILT n=1 Tax=Rosa chinensis TaxID=74649 RepID=A0A2P6R8V0_ROSCH|nr:gamma-interferon-responsive lysosomal thiol protein isoform X2 [Rosa chinensis]PRQ42849.1 putative gamma interferon inducible lysosomal thiol reductase GILT [Rosa chinensis]
MASLKLLFSLVVLTSVLSIQASYPSFEDNGVNVLESKKVNLSLYYETLCPSCASFIVNELAATLFDPEGDLVSIVNLRLVPYGNAQVKAPNKTIVCQKRHFKFIHCLESKLIEGLHSSKEYAWESCCVKLEMDSDRLGKCYRSGYEKKLILENAKETDHLVPPHEYVPWVVVNGQPLKDDYLNFVRYVCNAYKDSPKPKACRSYQHNINSGGKANSSLEGCYKGDQNAGGAETLQ